MAIKQKPMGEGMTRQPGGDWQYIAAPLPCGKPDSSDS